MKTQKILIVDDELSVRELLSEMITYTCGYPTDCAVDGLDGLDKIQHNEYELVFTDMKMPRLNGLDFLKKVKMQKPYLPVVLITAYSNIDLAVKAMKEGASDFVTKPFKPQELKLIIDKLLSEKMFLSEIAEDCDCNMVMEKLNSNLYQKLREISTLYFASAELDEIFDNKELFEKTVDIAERLFKVKEASFGIVQDTNIEIKNAVGCEKKMLPIKGTIFEKVLRTKTYYIAPPGEINPHNGAPLNSPFFSIPFILNSKVVGVLSLSKKINDMEFGDNEILLAMALAKKAGLKMENNALYESIFSNLMNTLNSLITVIGVRDFYTKQHSERIVAYALGIAETMQCGEDIKDIIRVGGFLHDIGKIGVSDTVLLKPTRLNDDEIAQIRMHPVLGDNIIKPLGYFPKERLIIRHHHENYNGTGYPDGLAAGEIPFIARIVSIVDTYDAMTTDRPYRKALGHDVAVAELQRCAGTQFDPEIVKAFCSRPPMSKSDMKKHSDLNYLGHYIQREKVESYNQ